MSNLPESIVAVTGGSGFIGTALVRRLLADGQRVSNLDLWAEPDSSLVRAIRGDVRNATAVRLAVQGCSTVYHLAAAHHDHGIDRDTFFGVNEGGTRTLVEACAAEGVRRIVFFSSVAVYGTAVEPRDDMAATAPESPYGESKLAGERVLTEWASGDSTRELLVVRPAVVFGRMNFANVFALIRQIDSGRFARVGEGTNVKSMVYVENALDAVHHLLAQLQDQRIIVANLVDKPDLSSREIMETIERALARRPRRVAIPLGVALALAYPFELASTIIRRPLPVSRARVRKFAEMSTQFPATTTARYGFAPSTPLRSALADMVAWYLREGKSARPIRRLPPPVVLQTVTDMNRAIAGQSG